MFQPFYVGGALCNDKKISLGDLFKYNEDSRMHLQFVHDFGDWWSHTIRVSEFKGKLPDNASVAHLLSGHGACPPDDTGGILDYDKIMKQLTGKYEIAADKGVKLSGNAVGNIFDPTSETWWGVLNDHIRGKLNGPALFSPVEFDLERARVKLDTAIRKPTVKVGEEMKLNVNSNFTTGITSQTGESLSVASKVGNPKKSCAVCGVTVALKICSGCDSIAFCSREHQVKYWPKHKSECKRIQKQLGR
jgi:hypothetical protein